MVTRPVDARPPGQRGRVSSYLVDRRHCSVAGSLERPFCIHEPEPPPSPGAPCPPSCPGATGLSLGRGLPSSPAAPRATCNACFLALAPANSFSLFPLPRRQLACSLAKLACLFAGVRISLSRLLAWAFRPLTCFPFQIPSPLGEKVCTGVRVPGPLVF